MGSDPPTATHQSMNRSVRCHQPASKRDKTPPPRQPRRPATVCEQHQGHQTTDPANRARPAITDAPVVPDRWHQDNHRVFAKTRPHYPARQHPDRPTDCHKQRHQKTTDTVIPGPAYHHPIKTPAAHHWSRQAHVIAEPHMTNSQCHQAVEQAQSAPVLRCFRYINQLNRDDSG